MTVQGKGLIATLALGASLVGCYGATENDPNENSGGSAGTTTGSGGSDVVSGSGGFAAGGYAQGGSAEGGSDGDPWPDPPTEPPTSVDLLFVVDNSISMADKQQLLRDAMPQLVRRLITPDCIEGGAVVGVSDSLGECAVGTPEFVPVTNLHLGIITSSLGGHGGQVCSSTSENPTLDDHARLAGSTRAGLSSWNGNGFLAWDPTGTGNVPAGESDPEALIANFQDHVLAAGENGCGYEAPLEAFYRFLIDPEPPLEVVQSGGSTVKEGIDETVLAQRDAFLRADSLVGVIILSDENDCSIVDEEQGWLVGLQQNNGAPFQMPRATSACATDPASDCCRSCASDESAGAPDGCGTLAADVECAKGSLGAGEDNLNLRCFDQKRRFGFDLLYPIERYVDGLSQIEVPDREGELVANPLFVRDGFVRHPSRVFLAAAVGVPWQDLSDAASLEGDGLRYLSAAELEAEGRWDVILGDPGSGVLPSDPLMIESPDPRSGTHPLLGVAVAPATSTDPQENPINGHEQAVTKRDDLQYACIFPLADPRVCDGANSNACDCNAEDADRNRPLCQPPAGGPASTTQYFAKAYPGVRHLQLLQRIGERSIVTSVCAKNISGEPLDPGYGYNPLSTSIVEYAAPILRADP
jgi:hypothetical protein